MTDIWAAGNGRVMTCKTGNGRELFIDFAIVLSKYRNKSSVYDYLFLPFNEAVSTSDRELVELFMNNERERIREVTDVLTFHVLDFKLSPFSERFMLSFG